MADAFTNGLTGPESDAIDDLRIEIVRMIERVNSPPSQSSASS